MSKKIFILTVIIGLVLMPTIIALNSGEKSLGSIDTDCNFTDNPCEYVHKTDDPNDIDGYELGQSNMIKYFKVLVSPGTIVKDIFNEGGELVADVVSDTFVNPITDKMEEMLGTIKTEFNNVKTKINELIDKITFWN